MIRMLYVKKKGLCVLALLVIIVFIAVKYSYFKSPTDCSSYDYSTVYLDPEGKSCINKTTARSDSRSEYYKICGGKNTPLFHG